MSHAPRTPELDGVTQANGTDAARAVADVERRFRRFIHEIAGLLDGSLRSVDIAHRALGNTGGIDPDAAARARAALATASHGLTGMSSLLRAARSDDSPTQTHHDGNANLTESLFDAAELVRPSAEARGSVLWTKIDDSVRTAPALPIFPVVLNALRNAVHATEWGSGGVIELRAWIDRGVFVLEVIDEGQGVPEDSATTTRVFAEGFTTKPDGMGIGLAICEEIVSSLGGDLTLTNRMDRVRGCVFRMRVPIAQKAEQR